MQSHNVVASTAGQSLAFLTSSDSLLTPEVIRRCFGWLTSPEQTLWSSSLRNGDAPSARVKQRQIVEYANVQGSSPPVATSVWTGPRSGFWQAARSLVQ